MKLCVLLGCWTLLTAGCGPNTMTFTYVRSWYKEPPQLVVNGESLEVTKASWVAHMGAPTFTIDTADGEACVWQNPWWAPRLGDATTNMILSFDREGNFVPTEESLARGICWRCGRDLRASEAAKCPSCGARR